jgi:lipopolysaccharide biosynthesis glycosyltransferase
MERFAVCCFANGHYLQGAPVALKSFRQNCKIPCDYILLTDDPSAKAPYSWIILHQVDRAPWRNIATRQDLFSGVCLKYESFYLSYDRIVVLDSDVLVLSDVTPLLTREYPGHDLIAVRDWGAAHYYRQMLFDLNLDPEKIINAGVLICKGNALRTDWRAVFGDIPASSSYDEGDQGYLNFYLQHAHANLDFFIEDVRYNYALDPCYPPCHTKAIVHFTGVCKPWLPDCSPVGYRKLYHKLWNKVKE